MALHTVLFWLAGQGSTVTSLAQDSTTVPTNVYLSNIAGSLSILCWFIVFTPQFWINYKRQSGESLSLVFLYIWLAGDIMNLIGATMENLLLTMRVLAWYYTIADLALIAQIFYYRKTSVKASFESVITHSSPEVLNAHATHHHGEHAPLVAGSAPNYAAISPSEHVHESEHDRVIHKAAMVANATAAAQHHDTTDGTAASGHYSHQRRASSHSVLTTASGRYRHKMARRRKMVRKALMILFPLALIAFFLWAYHDWLQCTIGHGEDSEEGSRCGRGNGGGHGKLPPPPPSSGDGLEDEVLSIFKKGDHHKGKGPEEGKTGFMDFWLPLLLGWGSALLYLGSRLPQIYKNWRLKSCEGLSIMMFLFSVFGNVFYVASIFMNSLEWEYLLKNMPWWLGSGGTLIFDFTIFFQFYIYRHNSPLAEALKEAAETGELDENALMATVDEDDSTGDEDEADEAELSAAALQQQNTIKNQKPGVTGSNV
ncbi:unnamed protein product [Mortierella alpina]